MAYTIPNESAAAFASQAKVFQADIDGLANAFNRTGVITGCAVTAQGTPDMTLAVASGVIVVNKVARVVAAGNVTITTADATNPRIDLVVVSSSGTKSVTAGTPAATPEMPAIPASSVVLAAVYVPANDTAIQSNQITDKRALLARDDPKEYNVKDYGAVGDSSRVRDGAMTSGSAVLTCSLSAPFLSTDVGKTVWVRAAGASTAHLITTVASYTSATQVTLSANAGTTVSDATVTVLRTDDTTAIQAALDALPSFGGARLVIPAGVYNVGALTLSGKWDIVIEGQGNASILAGQASTTTLYLNSNHRILVREIGFYGGAVGLSIYGASLGGFKDLQVEMHTGDGILLNGDASTELYFSDIFIADSGGIGFHYTRTSADDTGGIYLKHIDIARGQIASSTGGFVAEATTTVGAFIIADQMVCDGFTSGPAVSLTKLTNVWFNQLWATGTRSAAGTIRIDACAQGSFSDVWAQNASNTGYIFHILNACNSIMFDSLLLLGGGSGTVGVQYGTLDHGALLFGKLLLSSGTSLTNDESQFASNASSASAGHVQPSLVSTYGPVAATCFGFFDATYAGTNAKYIRSYQGNLDILNDAFSTVILRLSDAGNLTIAGQLTQAGSDFLRAAKWGGQTSG